MKKSESKNVYIYDIGEGLELLNVCSKDPVSGKIDRVDALNVQENDGMIL